MTALKTVRRGDPFVMEARTLNTLIDRSRREVTGPGVKVTPSGWHLTPVQTSAVRWFYLLNIHIETNLLSGYVPTWSTEHRRWITNIGDENLVTLPPAPGYKVPDHFEFFQIGMEWDADADALVPIDGWDGQPSVTDMACKIIASSIVPHARMKFVAPAKVEELCEPCRETARPRTPGLPGVQPPISAPSFSGIDALIADDFQCCGGTSRGT